MRNFNKIFCIGWPKTATSSLRQAFEDFGFTYNPPWNDVLCKEVYKTESNALDYINKYDVFFTTKFERLEELFPGSLYICTYHNPYETAFRMVKHTYNLPQTSILTSPRPERLQSERLFDLGWCEYENSIEKITNYYDKVFKHFFNIRDRFLILDIIKDSKKSYDNLCTFLDMPKKYDAFPHMNKNTL